MNNKLEEFEKVTNAKNSLVSKAVKIEDELKKTLYSLRDIVTDTIEDITNEQNALDITVNKEFVIIRKKDCDIEICRGCGDGEFYIDNEEDLEDIVIENIPLLLNQVKVMADIKEFLSDYRHIIGDDADYNDDDW